jgi:hypothetical protein
LLAVTDHNETLGSPERRPSRLTVVDLFVGFNAALFLLLASTAYWRRFLQFKTRADLPEFMVYATVLFTGILVAWWGLRRLSFRSPVLVLFEAGLLLHFSAGLMHPNGMRLYDLSLGVRLFDYPLRFDKVVHFFNAYVGCALTLELFRLLRVRIPRVRMLVVALTVIGVGAVIEMIEYMVVKTVPHNGVGDYDNNMTDLIANLAGCVAYAATQRAFAVLGRRLGAAAAGLGSAAAEPAVVHGCAAVATGGDPGAVRRG